MANTMAFNPIVTTTAAGSFNVSSSGLVAGTAFADPSARNWLSGGTLYASAALPMWGGVGITELVPTPGSTTRPNSALGTIVDRATNVTANTTGQLTGFSVFDQAHNMVQSPQSPVPMATPGMSVNFYRLGSNARIVVPCSDALASFENGVITGKVSWDFVNQLLVPYTPGYSDNAASNAVWASTSGGQITFTVGTDPRTLVFAGDYITTSTFVNTGGASTGAFNGTWEVVSTTSTTIVVSAPASASIGTYASGGQVNAAVGGALDVKILDVDIGNSMVPVYSSTTGFLTWNRSGNAAVILI